jgi:hypothetical protein
MRKSLKINQESSDYFKAKMNQLMVNKTQGKAPIIKNNKENLESKEK